MKKVAMKLTYREMQALTFWINERITSNVRTEQVIFEYLLTANLQRLQQGIYKRMDAIFYTGTDNSKLHNLGIKKDEAVTLNVFFSRFGSTVFLQPVFAQLGEQIAKHGELVDVLRNKQPGH